MNITIVVRLKWKNIIIERGTYERIRAERLTQQVKRNGREIRPSIVDVFLFSLDPTERFRQRETKKG